MKAHKNIPPVSTFGKTVLILLLAGLAGRSTAAAQEPERELDRRVDVSREYLPDMDRAAKLTIAPIVSDTVALRPVLEYTVEPSPWVTGFGVAAINPVRVDATSLDRLLPFYFKAGFGAPARSVVDLYATTTSTGGGYAGGYLNHNGYWSKLKNDFYSRERAMESSNRVGIFGRTYLGKRIALSGEVGYDYDIRSKYNFSEDYLVPHASPRYLVAPRNVHSSELMSYSTPRLAVGIGNDFTDLSFFNFSVGAEGYLLRGRRDARESGIRARFALGKMFNVHQLKLSAVYDGAYGGGARDGYDVSVVSVTPSYLLEEGKLRVGASVEIAYANDKLSDRDKTHFLPSAEFSIRLAGGAFTPFARLRSELVSNTYRNMATRMPYIYEGDANISPAQDYKLQGGIRGDVAANFSYEVRAGGGIIKDLPYLLLSPATGYANSYVSDKLKYFTAGVGLTGRISDSFSAGLDADYYKYSANDDGYIDLEKAHGRPQFTGTVHFSYNWKDKLFLKIRGTLTGKRYYYYRDWGRYESSSPTGITVFSFTEEQSISTVFDLGLDAEYRLTRNLGVFLSGENLLGQKLYPYPGYRGFGVGVTAGVKLMF